MEDNIIVLEDENGDQIDFAVIDVFLLNDKTYFALVEAEDIENAEDVLIMRVDGEGDDAELVTVDDDDELDAAFEEFCRRDSEDDGEE